MVEKAKDFAAKTTRLAEEAIANGALKLEQLFDTNYRRIEGSKPPRYRTELSDWAHQHWRPILDVSAETDGVMAAACTDMNGFLPTHLTRYSQTPTGDLSHDTRFCRNGRIIFDAIDKKAKTSTDDYMRAVYRQEGDGKTYNVVRNVYVPIVIEGRRWGNLELAYTFDGQGFAHTGREAISTTAPQGMAAVTA